MSNKKVMLITGTSRSIGRYLAEYYARRDYSVIGCSRKKVDFSLPNYRHSILDVNDENMVKQLFSDINKEYGRLDVLINNAGVQVVNYVAITTLKTVIDVFGTNFNGPFLFCREAVKIMKKNKGGCIINISSIAVPLATPGSAIYGASKAALEQFSKVLAKEVAGDDIKIRILGLSIVQGSGMVSKLNESVVKEALAKTSTKKAIAFNDISQVIDSLIENNNEGSSDQVIYF